MVGCIHIIAVMSTLPFDDKFIPKRLYDLPLGQTTPSKVTNIGLTRLYSRKIGFGRCSKRLWEAPLVTIWLGVSGSKPATALDAPDPAIRNANRSDSRESIRANQVMEKPRALLHYVRAPRGFTSGTLKRFARMGPSKPQTC